MTGARRFLFGEDFRHPAGETPGGRAREVAITEAHARGVEAGRAQAASETERLVALSLDAVATGLACGLDQIAAAEQAIETQALVFYEALARKLAGQALADRPLGPLADAAGVAFRHLRGVPHLAVRLNEALVERADALLARLARERGYEGRIIVLGDDSLAPGDARFEWADGGVVSDRRALEDGLATALAAGRPDPTFESEP